MTGTVVVVTPDELRALMGAELARALAPLARVLAEAAKPARPAEPKADAVTAGTCTAKAVAAALGVDRRELRRLVAAGDFPPPFKVGPRRIRFRRADVEAFLSRGGAGQ